MCRRKLDCSHLKAHNFKEGQGGAPEEEGGRLRLLKVSKAKLSVETCPV